LGKRRLDDSQPGWRTAETMPQRRGVQIEAYRASAPAVEAHDPHAFDVAKLVADTIRERLPEARVEHVGSTAVPGCAGKGIVDLVMLYANGDLARARETLDELGFQRQQVRDPFPEDRPMRVGALMCDGQLFLVHVHVVSESALEAKELLAFRDALRADPVLRQAYVMRKREILASGVDDSLDYCYAKGNFIEETLRRIGAREHHHPQ